MKRFSFSCLPVNCKKIVNTEGPTCYFSWSQEQLSAGSSIWWYPITGRETWKDIYLSIQLFSLREAIKVEKPRHGFCQTSFFYFDDQIYSAAFFLFVGQSIKNVENKMNFWRGKAFSSIIFFPSNVWNTTNSINT